MTKESGKVVQDPPPVPEIVILGEMAQVEEDKRWCNADAFKLGLREGASSVQGEKEELAEERANKSSSHQSNKSLNTSTT